MWKVLDLQYKIESGSVIKIIAEYRIQQTINTKVFLERKIVNVELEEVEVNPNFIPFDELTEEIVAEVKKPFVDGGKPQEVLGVFFTSFVIL